METMIENLPTQPGARPDRSYGQKLFSQAALLEPGELVRLDLILSQVKDLPSPQKENLFLSLILKDQAST